MIFQQHTACEHTKARTGTISTAHGAIPTPIFMPVGTLGTVKAVSQNELNNDIKAPIILGNTYHLYLRPGNEIIHQAGGLHPFMNWDGAILTDSGGYQVFSLSGIRKLHEEGVTFQSHIDGSRHTFTPENVVETQRILGSDIMMILDECPPHPSSESYARESMELTHRWAKRGRDAFLAGEPKYHHHQLQFGIVQGSTYPELRRQSCQTIAELDFEGNAIGGLSVGEPTETMYEITDLCTDHLPKEKPRYLMGVGTPANLLENIALGVDMFDCVMPTRNARNGMLFTRNGIINIKNAKWKTCFESPDPGFQSETCQYYTLAYLHHLFKSDEILGLRLASLHNLVFYLDLMREVRERIQDHSFHSWYSGTAAELAKRL